jgi:hypothetical protein
MPANASFNTVYNTPFVSFNQAKEACKTWAIDSGNETFALTKQTNAGGSGYNCHVGTLAQSNMATYKKSVKAYTVVSGTTDANRGGLLKNGLIGVYNSGDNEDIGENYLISNITSDNNKPTEIATFNLPANNPWYGGGWSPSAFPAKDAKWVWKGGNNSDYIYGFYTNPSVTNITATMHMLVDNAIKSVSFNGEQLTDLNGKPGYSTKTISIKPGLNIFEFYLLNYSGPAGLVFALVNNLNSDVLLKTGNAGFWGSSTTQLNYDNLITKNNSNKSITYMTTYTHSDKKFSPYSKCDPFGGGDILRSSIQASFGRNCNNQTVPPLNARYIMVYNPNANNRTQVVQLVVYGYNESNQLVNLALKGRPGGGGNVYASPSISGCNATTNKYVAIDGNYGNRKHNNCAGGYLGEKVTNGYWLLDLGKSYDITEIIYYNRLETNSGVYWFRRVGMEDENTRNRASGMMIKLYSNAATLPEGSIPPINITTATPIKTYTLTADLIQKFEVIPGNN